MKQGLDLVHEHADAMQIRIMGRREWNVPRLNITTPSSFSVLHGRGYGHGGISAWMVRIVVEILWSHTQYVRKERRDGRGEMMLIGLLNVLTKYDV